MSINENCYTGKENLPVFPCGYEDCPWYVHNSDYNNCFWIIASIMYYFKDRRGFSVEEIAQLENLTEEEVKGILGEAMRKIRTNCRDILMDIWEDVHEN